MPKKTVLTEASGLVFGPRAATYGHPKSNFTAIAAMWDAYLIKRGLLDEGSEGIQPRDVAMMHVLVKVAREAHKPTRDNLVDIAGYAATAERLEE
jgi:Domain of unknown function (DUF6378)